MELLARLTPVIACAIDTLREAQPKLEGVLTYSQNYVIGQLVAHSER